MFLQETKGAVDTPEGVHLLFRQMVRTTDPSIGGDTVSHTGMNIVPTVVLLQPVDVVVVIAPGSISQLYVIETVSLAQRGQM